MRKKVTKFLQSHLVFILIFLFGFALRIISLVEVPPSLNWDEISHGYNAYSILETEKDEWGIQFPTIFRAYGDYKLPVYIYAVVPSISLFGLNEFAVRLPSFLGGLVTIVFTYLLTAKLFEKTTHAKKIAEFAAFLVAISPWTFFLSRGAFEANLAIPFFVGGLYFFLRGLEKPGNLSISSILLGLSVWTYNSERVFLPLFLPFLLVMYYRELRHVYKTAINYFWASSLLLSIFFIPMFWQLANPVGQARYEKVSILNESTIYQIEEARNTTDLSPFLARLVYNKPVYFLKEVSSNWLSHYSPSFLFTDGGSQYQFSVPGYGLLYLVTAPFLLLGILLLIKQHSKTSFLLLFWFFAGSIASAITSEAPHVLRSVTMLPSPMIISGVGIVAVYQILQKRKLFISPAQIFIIALFFVLSFSLFQYLSSYFNQYKIEYSWSWQYGYKEAVHYASEHYDEYDAIITTKKYGEPHEFFLFYNKWNSQDYNSDLIRYEQSDWFWVDRFDKYWFVNDWDIPKSGSVFVTESKIEIDCENIRCLLVTRPNNAPSLWNKIKTVNFLDGEVAFELYENR